MHIYIKTEVNNETAVFAKEELARYLKLLDKSIEISDDAKEGFTLGYLSETDEEIDTVSVEVDGLSGEIRGSNPRSILFSVYRYLEAVGIRWIRHGADGEILPENHDFSADRQSITYTFYQHRAGQHDDYCKVAHRQQGKTIQNAEKNSTETLVFAAALYPPDGALHASEPGRCITHKQGNPQRKHDIAVSGVYINQEITDKLEHLFRQDFLTKLYKLLCAGVTFIHKGVGNDKQRKKSHGKII